MAYAYSARLPPTCDLDLPDEYLHETATLIRSLPSMMFNLQLQIAINDSKVYNHLNFSRESEELIAAIEEYQK